VLIDLGTRALRRHAKALEVPDTGLLDASGLAKAILGAVGFTVPAPPVFTFLSQLEAVRRRAEELPLAEDLDTLRGTFLAGAQAVELAVRHGTIAWLQAIDPRLWHELLANIFRTVRNEKPFRGMDALSFGDWIAVFGALPQLEDKAPSAVGARLAVLRRALRKRKAQKELDTHVGVRNRVEHNKENFLDRDLREVRADAAGGLRSGAQALQTLIDEQALPQVLQPLDERRDRWNRLLLRTSDERGVRVELRTSGSPAVPIRVRFRPSSSN
jgi:hypothetical protein